MRRTLQLLSAIALLALPATVRAQSAVDFSFAGRTVAVQITGRRVEALPVLRLIGARAAFSPAAGTYGVVYDEHLIQFAPEHRSVLVDGELQEADDPPLPSPGGVSVTLGFLDRHLLAPLGYHLEPAGEGFRILPGAHFADPVMVRPVAADFQATTTVVLTLGRPAEARATTAADGAVVEVTFPDAEPHVDSTTAFRSRRVEGLKTSGQRLDVELADGVGLLSWHTLDDPPRVILELGPRRPTPTPAASRLAEPSGPAPIVIDPGHGGDDTGAVSPDGLMEKDLVLGIARRLKRTLEASGYTVRLTRDGDEGRALTDRTAVANRLEARVFVSLHANASVVSAVNGAETYYMSLDEGATDQAAADTASLENQAADAHRRSALDLILWDLAQAEVLNESSRLAVDVQQRLNASLGLRDRGVKQAPFVVLTGATMPAILVEVGFLSNADEARRLATPEHQERVAAAIALGVRDFLGGP